MPFDNKRIVSQNFTGKNKLLKIVLFVCSVIREFFLIKFFKPNIIYFTCSRSKFGFLKDKILLSLANKINKPKIITHLHGTDFKSFFENADNNLKQKIKSIYSKVDIAIVLLEEMKDQFKSILPEQKIHIVANFYDKKINTYNNDILNKINSNKKIINLIYFSNIMQTKGIFYLLEAYNILVQNNFSVNLNIAGNFIGDYELDKKQIKTKFFNTIKTTSNITYKGVLKNEDKYQFLANGDIFILPSYYRAEALPLSIIEAMASGNAIITTNHNYLSSVVNSNSGLIVEPKSSNQLYSAILQLIKNKDNLKLIQQYNFNLARQKYSEKNYIEGITKILTQ